MWLAACTLPSCTQRGRESLAWHGGGVHQGQHTLCATLFMHACHHMACADVHVQAVQDLCLHKMADKLFTRLQQVGW